MIQLSENLWLFEGPNVSFFGAPYPTRSVIAKLDNGDLWVWSPIQLSDEIADFIKRTGTVKHLVSPNKLHYLFLREWKKIFPEALLWGPASTIRKCPDLNFEMALTEQAPPSWASEIEQFWFQGSPFLDEVVFFHKQSRTAIFADLTQNFSETFLKKNWNPWLRALAHLAHMTEPTGFGPLELRLTWFRKAKDRKRLQRLLQMEPEKVIMAHGVWQNTEGRRYLETAFRWLL